MINLIQNGQRLQGGPDGNLNNAARVMNPIISQLDSSALNLIRQIVALMFPFAAKITEWEELDTDTNQFKYAWAEVARTSVNTYTDSSALKRVGTLTTDFALNVIEAVNDGSGVHGNSVDVDGADYPAGFEQKPVGAGTGGTPDKEVVVIMHPIVGSDGIICYEFQYENADDGTCV